MTEAITGNHRHSNMANPNKALKRG